MPAALTPPYGDSVLARDPRALREARRAAGWSGARLAKAIGVSPAAIGHLETGHYKWTSLRTAKGISERVGMDITALFDTSALGLTVFGREMRDARAARGLSRAVLAAEVGLSPGTIEQLENGTRVLLWRDPAERIALALDCDLGELFAEQEIAVPA